MSSAALVQPQHPGYDAPAEPRSSEAVQPPMRVLFVNDTSRNGGPGRSLAVLLTGLDPRRFVPTVLLPRDGAIGRLLVGLHVARDIIFDSDLVENPVAPGGRSMERSDYEASWIRKSWRAAGNGLRALRGILRLAWRARRGGFDLIYCNGTTANFFGALAGGLARVPVLWHVRYTGIAPLVRPLHDVLARSKTVRRIVCVSHAAAALFPSGVDKVAVVANGVDEVAWRPGAITGRLRIELGLSDKVIVFGSHGRVLRRKGYLEFLSAAHDLLRNLSRAERLNCHFAIIGDTPADEARDHVQECRARAQALGIGDQVSFLGFQSDPRPFVADFDVAVVPSVYADPLPRAVMESMAFGKPIVAFALGGVPEMVRDGIEGLLVPGAPPDIAGLCKALDRYRVDPELRARHGRAARLRVERMFSASSHAGRMAEHIERAVGRPPA